MLPIHLPALTLQVVSLSLACLASAAQTVADKPSELTKDPQAVFAAAAPFYDYSSPTLKPFHLKATYQLYENGQPAEQGTFEYWFRRRSSIAEAGRAPASRKPTGTWPTANMSPQSAAG